MDPPIDQSSIGDLKDYLAEERAFLAWIRTGIALMGLGIVVARFGIFAGDPDVAPYARGVPPHGFVLWFGAALVAIGVTVNVFSAWRYSRLIDELNRGVFGRRSVSKQGAIVALLLATLGGALAIYMISFLE